MNDKITQQIVNKPGVSRTRCATTTACRSRRPKTLSSDRLEQIAAIAAELKR